MESALQKSNLTAYASTPLCDGYVVNPNFYTSISQCSLALFRMDDVHFMGIVSFKEFQPAVSDTTSEALLITDSNNTIVAYNQVVVDLLQSKEPASLLRQPLESIVEFTVRQDETQRLPNTKPRQIPLEASFFSCPEPHQFMVRDSPELKWENKPAGTSQYLYLNAPIEQDYCDYRLSFTAMALRPGFPCIILRARQSDLPDTLGYLFGPSADDAWLLLKKKGFQLIRIPYPGPQGTLEYRICVEKTGNLFNFYLNDSRVISHEERYPMPPSTGLSFAFWIRPNACFSVGQMSLSASRRKMPAEAPVLAKLKSCPQYTFRVHQEPAAFSGESLNVYQFQNITTFEKKLSRLQKEKQELSEKMQTVLKSRQTLVQFEGENIRIKSVKENLGILAHSAHSLLLTGETGTGKEVLARLFHDLSPRSTGPFVKVDCATLPAALLESELFGYEPGAFTGAAERHVGRFERAQNGTLFLDEIANLSLETQAKLLGFLDDYTITRLGGASPLSLSLNLVAAANRDLKELVLGNLFRQDLYYRLGRFGIEIPPLRERMDDLPLLCRLFITQANQEYGKNVKTISENGYVKLYSHNWPGNVRELKNVVFKAVLFSPAEQVLPEHLEIVPMDAADSPGRRSSVPQQGQKTQRLNRQSLVEALEKYEGNIAAAADYLRITRTTLYNRINKYGLQINDFRMTRPSHHQSGGFL
ncbi:MAG: sigma-54 dependent transcriptional regulator [Fibrobacterota bacterium]